MGHDNIWTKGNDTIESVVPVTIGVWHLNGINPAGLNFDELDLYAEAALGSLGGFDVELGYIPKWRNNTQSEIGLALIHSLGFLDLALETNYNFTLNAWYHHVGIEKSLELTDSVSQNLGAGWNDGYIQANISNWSH